MGNRLLIQLMLACIIWCACQVESEETTIPDEFVMKLFKLIQDDQKNNLMLSTQKPPFYRRPGLYTSLTKNNFHGKPNSAVGRTIGVFDNNLFTTNFINTMLLEAYYRGRAPAPSSEQLRMPLDLVPIFMDQNKPYESSIAAYWPMAFDEKTMFWRSNSENHLALFDLLKTIQQLPLYDTLSFLGYSDFADFIKYFEKLGHELLTIAFIPMDTDCTVINLGVGSILLQGKDKFPLAWEQWKGYNTNLSSALDSIKDYSYRPFSGDSDSSSIDPRSYYVFRHFLDEAKAAGKDVALPTTWTQSRKELSWQKDKGMAMYRNVNNVCLGVTANTVYGITSSILSGLVNISVLDDPLLAQIYHNSSALLLHSLANNMTGRPDLALVYYPSRVQVEWFISRSLAKLEDAVSNGPLPSPVLGFVYKSLKAAMRVHATQRLVEAAQAGSGNTLFFEEFLGTDDFSATGASIKTGEDRIFSTGMALNVLINSWTSFDSKRGTLKWVTGTPHTVKLTVSRTAAWLTQNTFSGKYRPGGAFFAGSYKWESTWPNYYPGNRYQFYNGTTIHDWKTQKPNSSTSFFMEGYVSPDSYSAMLGQTWFGGPTPRDFHGYNAEKKPFFAYWESEPLTYTITMQGLSMYRNIEE
ncbi:hypothetical protein EGW08_003746 [Elysia chlorotica]|uniref:Uncharacterized protein n=1 Tax=Elysia chlorotica TaxID=188477 RepID=A0A3S0ZXL0_ELYCH|nr:hypothetical protein EGW08_003746 [Elysia chlorotica]